MQGPFSRTVALHYLFPKAATVPHLKPQPLWGLGSKRFGGRYTPKNSFETIYMAKDMVTALKEVQALISIPSGPAFTIVTVPWVTVAIQGFLSSVLDLTQSANVEAVGSSYQELTGAWRWVPGQTRSEEHTSELQSQSNLVCRLLLEKKTRSARPSPLTAVSTAAASAHINTRATTGS